MTDSDGNNKNDSPLMSTTYDEMQKERFYELTEKMFFGKKKNPYKGSLTPSG